MRYKYRVTKYDPKFRDRNGRYLKNEWTDCSDIGKNFGGTKLSKRDYLKIESAYLDAIKIFLKEAKVKWLFLKKLENNQKQKLPNFVKQGSELKADQIVKFAQLVLRNKCWGLLTVPRFAYVHFGWDFYMYFGLPSPCEKSILAMQKRGLFVEPFRSPYLRG